ncbi:hypothetical protein BTEBP_190020 [Brochothrix thermosphacta]|nr:hypothetical protein BTEBP_190020 [Brochothrix thermosphacta]
MPNNCISFVQNSLFYDNNESVPFKISDYSGKSCYNICDRKNYLRRKYKLCLKNYSVKKKQSQMKKLYHQ